MPTDRDSRPAPDWAWSPRRPDEADAMPDPRATRLAHEHLAEGRRLRRLRDDREREAARPRRPYVGPAMAARLGVEPTTP